MSSIDSKVTVNPSQTVQGAGGAGGHAQSTGSGGQSAPWRETKTSPVASDRVVISAEARARLNAEQTAVADSPSQDTNTKPEGPDQGESV